MPLTGEDDLVGSIYDAALSSLSWQDIGNRLVRHMEASTLMLLVHDPVTQSVDLVTTLGLTPKALAQYGEYYAHHDLWVMAARERQLFDQILLGSNVVEDHILEQSQFYHDFLRPVGIHHLAGAMLKTADGKHAVIGTQRPRDARAYDERESRRLARILPHLQRALEIRQRLRHAEAIGQSAVAAFDRLSLGVIMMGPTGKLLHVNAAADAILRAGDGLLRVPGGIRAMGKHDDKRLQELIVGARRTSGLIAVTAVPGGHVQIGRPSGRQAYAVMVAPVGPELAGTGKGTAAVVVFISDPGQQVVSDLAILRALFDFPPSEARLVLALLNGVAPPDFARQAGLSYHTVRTLLARAMDRTETRSQVELVLLVARSFAGLANEGSSPDRDTPAAVVR